VLLALDISTKTGYAVFNYEGALITYGVFNVSPKDFNCEYPRNYIYACKNLSAKIKDLIKLYNIDKVIIEETNNGGFLVSRFTRKLLEWFHYELCNTLLDLNIKIIYIDSRKWQSIQGLILTKEQKNKNKILKEKKEINKKMIIQKYKTEIDLKLLELKQKLNKKEFKEQKKLLEKELKNKVANELMSFSQEFKGGTSKKHLSVNKVNELFKLNLKLKDNDISDAILIGKTYFDLYK
jgi:hypothetical protein